MIFFRLKPSTRWEKHQHCHSRVLNVVWSLILLHLYSFIMIPVANADALRKIAWEDWNDWDAGFCWSFTLVRDGRVWIFGPQVNQFGLRIEIPAAEKQHSDPFRIWICSSLPVGSRKRRLVQWSPVTSPRMREATFRNSNETIHHFNLYRPECLLRNCVQLRSHLL